MKTSKTYKIIIIMHLIFVCGCREEIELETENFESVLVVEGVITNELRQQHISLSKTTPLEQGDINYLNNAIVKVVENGNNEFTFSQNTLGIYVSDIAFQAQENLTYKLKITTEEGKTYESFDTLLTPVTNISNLYAELNSNGETLDVLIDSNDDEGTVEYYRYEYDETYKIIAPFHSNFDATVENYLFEMGVATYDIEITEREQEERVCFTTKKSNKIILANTESLNDNQISRFSLRSINIDNPILIDRYSILVRQYAQNIKSHTFYKTIKELGSISSILSESQPGFVFGNIKPLNPENNKVIGYFEVSSVATERIYFNFVDYDLPRPDYFYECDKKILDYSELTNIDSIPNQRRVLRDLLSFKDYKLVSYAGTTYTIVNPECGDCTSFSSNVQPDFWED